MRRYRPFLTYSAKRGWGFYVNRNVTPLTTRNIGQVELRRKMREHVGGFVSAELAIRFEKVAQNVR